MTVYLNKSDFTHVRSCATKLYYRKLRYPSSLDRNPYLEFLADGGYMVETMARLLFPDGREIGLWDDPVTACDRTGVALSEEDVTLFDATVISDNLLARVDILHKEQEELHLIEVKSSSVDMSSGDNPFRGAKGGILAKWREYLEDITFQTVVLKRAFPELVVCPSLCLVDKSKTASDEVIFDKFRLRRPTEGDGYTRPEVEYLGDLQRLRNEHLLAIVDVSAEVEELETEIAVDADSLAATLRSNPISRADPVIGKKCKGCEYRISEEEGQRNGFHECWDALAGPDPHMLDLYRVDLLGGKNHDVIADLVSEGLAGLHDIPERLLSGATATRQRLQLEYTARGEEFIAPELSGILTGHPYPLHFIDFEGSRMAIPYHVGMHPYEQTAFQWSRHTIQSPGAELQHMEWLNTEDAFPNGEFAQTLMEHLGTEGTIYIWSHYELDVLREIREQCEEYGFGDETLKNWLDEVTNRNNPRVVDLCDLAKDAYFNPSMKGSLSIKYVLPAVWNANRSLHSHPCFSCYARYDSAGKPMNPYDTLPPLPIGEKEEIVSEGTGAMRVYQEMMFGPTRDEPATCDAYKQLLLQYCELDTAAMVMIWMHWSSRGT